MNDKLETPVTERAAPSRAPTRAEIDAAIAKAHRLRAEAMGRLFSIAASAVADGLRRLFIGRTGAETKTEGTPLWHDLRTPLTAIRASSELLIDNPDMPQEHRRRFLDSIHEEALRLEAVVDGINDRVGPGMSSSRA